MKMQLVGKIRLGKWFDDAASAATSIASSNTKIALIAIADSAKKVVAKGRGNLARSIGWELEGVSSGIVGSPLRYAAARALGSGLWGPKKSKYPIVPKNRNALGVLNVIGQKKKFRALSDAGYKVHTFADGGKFAFIGKKVMHPGAPGDQWMQRAIHDAQPRIMKLTGKNVLSKIKTI